MEKYYYKKDEICPITTSVLIGSKTCKDYCKSVPTTGKDKKGKYIECIVLCKKLLNNYCN